MLKIKSRKATLVFLLPSCIEAEVQRMKAKHIKLFTNVGRASTGESMIDVLTSGVVVRIGKDTKINEAYINNMSPEDINALLLGLRIHSFQSDKFQKLTIVKEWDYFNPKRNHIEKRKQNHTLDVGVEAFQVDYVGGELVDKTYAHYVDIPNAFEVGDGLFLEAKKRKTLMQTFKNKSMNDLDYYSQFVGRVFREDDEGEKIYLSPKEFEELDIEITETLAEIDQQVHGFVDTNVTLTCAWDAQQQAQIDLMQTPAFFCPSRTQ